MMRFSKNLFETIVSPDFRKSEDEIFRFVLLINDHIYGENFKVTNPENFTFLDYRIEFLALKFDSAHLISSMILYVEGNDLLSKVENTFGQYHSAASTQMDVVEENITYESFLWKCENYTMLVAPLGVVKDKVMTRVWIARL